MAATRAQMQATIDRLTAENKSLRADIRRVCEERDWAEETTRVLRRVIERLGGANRN